MTLSLAVQRVVHAVFLTKPRENFTAGAAVVQRVVEMCREADLGAGVREAAMRPASDAAI